MRQASIAGALRLVVWLLATSVLAGGVPAGLRTATADQAAVGPGAYGLAVTGADQDFVPGDRSAQPPAGRKWVLVSASLQNLEGDTVVVEAGALALVDDDGQRYGPEPPSEWSRPSVVGATLARGEWVLGLALFDVPRDIIGEWLEWCPGGTSGCAAPLRSPIPWTPSGA